MMQHPTPQPAAPIHAQPAAPIHAQHAAAAPQPISSGGYTWMEQGEQVRLKVDGLLGFSSPNPLT